jgi:pyruvate dehydrogenase E1 component beta subunit
MKNLTFAQAIEDALTFAMSNDERIIVIGEDVQMIRLNLFIRFGANRILAAPISESAFLGAAVGAAMGGMRPVVEIMLIDFIGVAMDALLNHAAKTEFFSSGKWKVPLVVRAACGGGYGDGGQHEQSLWGWLAHIPGLTVVVPSTPSDAAGLMLAAIEHDGPVIYLEHKLLADYWLEYLGSGGRDTVSYDIPLEGAKEPVVIPFESVPLGKSIIRRAGSDVTLTSIAVGVHRSLEAAEHLVKKNISAEVIDLRSISPLDSDAVVQSVSKTGHLIVVDEDYRDFGLSGELAARLLESGIDFRYARVCTEQTIPYSRHKEDRVIPNTTKICNAVLKMLK